MVKICFSYLLLLLKNALSIFERSSSVSSLSFTFFCLNVMILNDENQIRENLIYEGQFKFYDLKQTDITS